MGNLTFVVEKDIDGGYNARAEKQAIFAQADTLEQLNLNIAEAIECHFDADIVPDFDLKFDYPK